MNIPDIFKRFPKLDKPELQALAIAAVFDEEIIWGYPERLTEYVIVD